MARRDVEEAVEKLLEPGLEREGLELVDVEYVRERNWILRIYIDKEGGVDLNDCQTVSEKGVKSFTAKLLGLAEDGALLLKTEEGEISLSRDKISQVRLHFSF